MQERIQFWGNSALWPNNVPGYVFAARAVHEVGKVIHGDAWTGTEPTTANPLDLRRTVLPNGSTFAPSQAVASRTVKETINALLRKFRPEFERKPVVYGPHGPEPLSFSTEEWQVGIELAEAANQKLVSAQKRLNDAIASIISACAEGHLISALRPKAGGRIGDPLPNYVWHTEHAANRFFWCQMSPNNPFGYSVVGGDGHQYIFFSRDSLDGYSRLLADASRPEPDRTTKTDYKTEKLIAWATELFNSVENNQRRIFTQAEFEAMARQEFPGVSIPKLRKEVWSGRPALFPRKAAKGA
ncbi:hypothetical protein [Mesorhizobium sp. NZP2077]|uniref:hypothetical protein n=1 Tax=Mesorhizobium sp. NZP2077 TaxID=2483404 RepID=UPI0015517362|nr:hypothetical protein [Mesorhizobium sp. NZP2077]QKC81519.1 hypothetical protein EB232_07550 [Mesorhizobium sp. NZP2077]QKD14970.1 hypothetical protein HGP13_07455 [Mesorhizobium sp. NZP2077]